MKLFHLSDLHIGKMLNGYSLRESQKNAFLQILKYAEEEKPDAILICGDIYDKSVPAGLSGDGDPDHCGKSRFTGAAGVWRIVSGTPPDPYRGAAAGRSDGVFKAGHTYR